MKKLIYRILAFMLDMLLCYFIILGLSFISYINPSKNDANQVMEYQSNLTRQYSELTENYNSFFEDNKIDSDEYKTLFTNYSYFSECFKDINIDEEVSEDKNKEILTNINNEYNDTYNKFVYQINTYNRNMYIIDIIVYILYFGILEFILHGKTVGKLLFRLKTVYNSNPKKDIPLWKYLIKAILISETIFLLVNIFIVNIKDINTYINIYKINSYIQYFYELAFIIVMILRDDERSIHDLLLNIRVCLYDKNGKEIESKIFNEETNN